MPLVDPADDSKTRYVLEHYRFDPRRVQRRNVVIAAYDNSDEFQAALVKAQAELVKRQEDGSAESVERLSGRVLPPGYSSYQKRRRLAWRRLTHGVHPDTEHR